MKNAEATGISRRVSQSADYQLEPRCLRRADSSAKASSPLPARPARQNCPAIQQGTNTSFASLKQIDAGLLNLGYAEDGPPDGPPVILLQGWPYDIYSYVDVAPLLAAKGYRVIVPYLRGYGSTRFLSNETFRNGQPYVVALDIIHLMDALNIQKAILAGFDWGGRTADIIAILWPERCKALVSVSGYLVGSPEANKKPLPPRPSYSGGTNTTLLLSVAELAMTNTAVILRSSFGRSPRPSGTSMMPHSSARRLLSTIRITSPS